MLYFTVLCCTMQLLVYYILYTLLYCTILYYTTIRHPMLSNCLVTNFPAHEFSYSPPYLQREPTFYSCLCLNRLAVVSNSISYLLSSYLVLPFIPSIFWRALGA